ncbi:hypothetical protein EJN29_23695 [Salmonella enterica]|nr:hypothetical protein [Salmonella enterica]
MIVQAHKILYVILSICLFHVCSRKNKKSGLFWILDWRACYSFFRKSEIIYFFEREGSLGGVLIAFA